MSSKMFGECSDIDDIIDLTLPEYSHIMGEIFWLTAEDEREYSGCLQNILDELEREDDEVCRKYWRNKTPENYAVLRQQVSRTATITKRKPEFSLPNAANGNKFGTVTKRNIENLASLRQQLTFDKTFEDSPVNDSADIHNETFGRTITNGPRMAIGSGLKKKTVTQSPQRRLSYTKHYAEISFNNVMSSSLIGDDHVFHDDSVLPANGTYDLLNRSSRSSSTETFTRPLEAANITQNIPSAYYSSNGDFDTTTTASSTTHSHEDSLLPANGTYDLLNQSSRSSSTETFTRPLTAASITQNIPSAYYSSNGDFDTTITASSTTHSQEDTLLPANGTYDLLNQSSRSSSTETFTRSLAAASITQNIPSAYYSSNGDFDTATTASSTTHSQEDTLLPANGTYDLLNQSSRSSSTETFTRPLTATIKKNAHGRYFDANMDFDCTPSSISSDDLSTSDQPAQIYSTITRPAKKMSIPLSVCSSSNLTSVSSIAGSESSLLYSRRTSASNSSLMNAIGSNGSQTISRGKLQAPRSKIGGSGIVGVGGGGGDTSFIQPASRLAKPNMGYRGRMRLPGSSGISQSSLSQASSQTLPGVSNAQQKSLKALRDPNRFK